MEAVYLYSVIKSHISKEHIERLVQDGRVEGRALTPSFENTGITTAEQSLTGRHWNSAKRYPTSKDRGEATMTW